jgi:hypothetical protein
MKTEVLSFSENNNLRTGIANDKTKRSFKDKTTQRFLSPYQSNNNQPY